MAFIGMQHVVAAKVATETAGSALTYSAGMVIGKAIQGNITWTHSDNPLYADDAIAENDNTRTEGSLELGLDDLLDDARVYVLGDTKNTVSTGVYSYELTDEPSPNVGVGYIRVRRKGGTTTYQGVWLYKVNFVEDAENTQTKGEQIEWQTPTITGKIMGVVIDSSGKNHFAIRQEFTTLSDAVSWLDTKASVPAQSNQ